MAETLRSGNLLDSVYWDGTDGARVPPGRPGALYDLGSVGLGWGLDSAVCPNSTHIDLTFGGLIDILGTALSDVSSYSISPALAIKSANIVGDYMVQLETARQVSGVTYTITLTAFEETGGGAPV